MNSRKNKKWTNEELDYISENWGKIAIKNIAKKLGRTENAVMIKAQRLNLGAFLEAEEYMTFNVLLKTLGLGSGSYKETSWIKNRNFPIKYKQVKKCKFKVVYINDFWEWLKNNRDIINFSKIEKNIFGAEPSWVKQQRDIDTLTNQRLKKTKEKWTKANDALLVDLLKQHRYSYHDISIRLKRSTGAIQRRICDLGIKERPVKAHNNVKWTQTEKNILVNMIKQGYDYELISDTVGRSSKAIRGRVYDWYGTESLDKVRQVIPNEKY